MHDAVTTENNFPDIPRRYVLLAIVYDSHFPVKAGFTGRAQFSLITYAEMNRAGAGSLTQSVVFIILHIWKVLFPAFDQTGGDRLRPDVHEAPAAKVVVVFLELSPIQCLKDIVSPGYQQPDYCPSFPVNGFKDISGVFFSKYGGSTAHNQVAEPVHLGSAVV